MHYASVVPTSDVHKAAMHYTNVVLTSKDRKEVYLRSNGELTILNFTKIGQLMSIIVVRIRKRGRTDTHSSLIRLMNRNHNIRSE